MRPFGQFRVVLPIGLRVFVEVIWQGREVTPESSKLFFDGVWLAAHAVPCLANPDRKALVGKEGAKERFLGYVTSKVYQTTL